jgi:hypothetical protein
MRPPVSGNTGSESDAESKLGQRKPGFEPAQCTVLKKAQKRAGQYRAFTERPLAATPQPTTGSEVRHSGSIAMASDEEFLLYPLDTGEDPACPACGALMAVAAHETRETKPDFIVFRCEGCGRSEKFVCDE